MKCPNCNTENPDNARFCRTCGMKLLDVPVFEEKEEEKIHVPTVEDNADYQQNNSQTSNITDVFDGSYCCICLLGIFIVFAIILIIV